MVGLLRQAHRLKRGNVYYFRIAIPTQLQSALGYEYKRSLKTGDLRIANHICRTMSNKAERFFDMIVANTPTDKDIKQLMRTYFECQLDKAMADYSDARAMCYGSEPEEPSYDPYGFVDTTNEQYNLLKQLSATDDYTDEQQKTASKMLKQRNFEDIINSDFLATQLMQASIEAKRIELAYHQRNPSGMSVQHPKLKGCRNIFENLEQQSVTLEQCTSSYLIHKEDAVSDKTLKGIKGYLNSLCNILGNERKISTLSKHPDGILLEQIIKKIPTNYTRDYQSQGVSIMDAVNTDEDYKTISNQTILNHWMYFQDFFNWAVDREYISHSPIERMKPNLQRHSEEKSRNEFSKEQLTKLFHSPIYTGRKNTNSALWKEGDIKLQDGNFWLPVIGLYTGMREGEILQITAEDVIEEDGILYFDINCNDNKHTKNKQSIRRVPVHQELIKMGFREYIDRRKSELSDTDRVFADNIVIPETQEVTKNYSRTFSKYTIKTGIRDEKDGKEVFHSFRHNMITALNKAGVSNIMASWVAGHKPPKEVQTTGDIVYLHSKPTLQELSDAINKINYDIDLSHLYQ